MTKTLKTTGKIIAVLIVLLGVMFLAFYICTSGSYEVAKTVEQDPSIPNIKIKNTIFHAETFGSDTSEVVIVLHGGPGNDYRYLLSLEALADEYFVVFYDQRGTGLSPRVDAKELTIDTMLNDLNNIIDYYSNGRKVNLIGHSWGAMLASGYIGKYPTKVNKAVLAEPGILTSEKAKEFIAMMKSDFSLSFLWFMGKCWFQSLHVDGPDKQASQDYFLTAMMLNADASLFKKHPQSKYYCDQDINNISFDYWRNSALSNTAIFQSGIDEEGEMHIDLVSGVENFKNKVLFLVGECNSLIGEAYQQDHMKYFNNAEMIVIKNSGHTMFGEQPQQSIDVVRRYFIEN